MNEQLNISFPEQPKGPTPLEQEQQDMKKVQDEFGVYKTLMRGEDSKWYVQDYDGTPIEVSEWKKKQDALYEHQSGDRKDIN